MGGFVQGFNASDSASPAFQFRFITVRNSGHMTPGLISETTTNVFNVCCYLLKQVQRKRSLYT